MLSLAERKALFKEIGLTYNKANILAFQKTYMLRQSDYDGIYGPNTENTLLTVVYTKRYTKNFSATEFRCDCGGRFCCGYPTFMKPHMLMHIQAIRDHYGRPITVTQGLRCKGRNKQLNGSIVNSKHLQGMAVDFYQKGATDTLANRRMAIKWIKKQPFHTYTYGDGINSNGYKVKAAYMGNCLHTDVK